MKKVLPTKMQQHSRSYQLLLIKDHPSIKLCTCVAFNQTVKENDLIFVTIFYKNMFIYLHNNAALLTSPSIFIWARLVCFGLFRISHHKKKTSSVDIQMCMVHFRKIDILIRRMRSSNMMSMVPSTTKLCVNQ